MKDIDAVRGQFRATSCEWTTGLDGKFFYKHCGKDVVPEKAYCAEHLAQAYYTPKRKKRVRA